MGNFRYITNRTLINKAGQKSGSIAVMVRNGSDDAEVKYRCPECGFSEQTKKPWKRPFSVKCEKCSIVMKVSKLKDEAKREKKKARK